MCGLMDNSTAILGKRKKLTQRETAKATLGVLGGTCTFLKLFLRLGTKCARDIENEHMVLVRRLAPTISDIHCNQKQKLTQDGTAGQTLRDHQNPFNCCTKFKP